MCNGPAPSFTIGFVTSNTEKPAPPLPNGTNNILCQLFVPSTFPSGVKPFINTSWTTGEPSTPNIALLPPLDPSTLPSRLELIIVGNFPINSGGRNAHSSSPVWALNAWSNPLFEPAYKTSLLVAYEFLKAW